MKNNYKRYPNSPLGQQLRPVEETQSLFDVIRKHFRKATEKL